MEDAIFDTIRPAIADDVKARTLAILVTEMPHLLCTVIGTEYHVNSGGMIITDDDMLYHSVRDLMINEIISFPRDAAESVTSGSGSPPIDVIGKMIMGLMGDEIRVITSPDICAAPITPLQQQLLMKSFNVPMFMTHDVMIAKKPDGRYALFENYDTDAFPDNTSYNSLHAMLVSAGLAFGGGDSLLQRVTFEIVGDDQDKWYVGPSVKLKSQYNYKAIDFAFDDVVLERAIASDVVDYVNDRKRPGCEVVVSSCEDDYAVICESNGWLFQKYYDADPMSSALVTISPAAGAADEFEYFVRIVVNPTCMRPIVDILSIVNDVGLSNAQLIIQLYPLIVTRYPSRIEPVSVDIVPFVWPAQERYFARFPVSARIRPSTHVSDLVIEDPYNTVDILTRYAIASGDRLPAQLPPIYDGTCAVCLSGDVQLAGMVQYDCRHVFCEPCAHDVMQMTGSNACPLCRRVTMNVYTPNVNGEHALIERVSFDDAIRQMRELRADGFAILSDVPEIMAAFPGCDRVRDFACMTVLFCGRPRLLSRALAMRNTFYKGKMNVKRFEIKDGLDEFARRYAHSSNDQMLAFWVTRTRDDNAKELQTWIDRFSSLSALRAWHGPGFFVHQRVLFNPAYNKMRINMNGYIPIRQMTDLFSAMAEADAAGIPSDSSASDDSDDSDMSMSL